MANHTQHRYGYRPAYCHRSPGMPVQITAAIPYDQWVTINAMCKKADCSRSKLLAKLIAKALEAEKA